MSESNGQMQNIPDQGPSILDRYPRFILGALFIFVWALATWQGTRVEAMRDATRFYRWINGQAVRWRVLQDSEDKEGENGKLMDRELFQSIVDTAESHLPEVITDEEGDEERSRLALYVRDSIDDQLIWTLASGPVLETQREDFHRYMREKRLAPVSSRFDANAVYGEGGADVSISNVFFGFRKIAANFVWLQVDRYWHKGMVHRMLPLMKTCVTLDPNFVDAFLLGAWHLAYNQTAKMLDTPEPLKEWHPKYKVRLGEKELYYYRAVDFLKDGIYKNPREYRLYFDLGYGIFRQKLKDYENAVRYLSEAIRHRHDKWVPRQLYQCLELNGQYEEALAGWQEYLRKNPENVVAPRFILRNKALIKERDGEAAKKRAESTQDPMEAQIARAESERLLDEARDIWVSMDEPFATARKLRLDALDYVEEGKYMEAIALLDHARYESPGSFFDEACDMIIDIKLMGEIPLSKSEKMAIERKKEAAKYVNLGPEQG